MRIFTKRLLGFMLIMAMITQLVVVSASEESTTRDPYEYIAAPSLDEFGGDVTVRTNLVGAIIPSDWVCFKNVDFGKVGPNLVEMTTTIPAGYAETVLIRIDSPTGQVIAEVPVTPSPDWEIDVISSANIGIKVTGVHDIYISPKKSTFSFRGMVFYTSDTSREGFYYERYSSDDSIAGAEGTAYERTVATLLALGIVSLDDEGKYDVKKSASRGEFADSIYRMLEEVNNEEETIQTISRFADVRPDYKYTNAIEYLSQRGIMIGVNETEFDPYSYISYMDALTVVLRALGYEKLAETSGDYPNGYIQMANKAKISLTGKGYDDYITLGDMASLLEKAIDADYLSASSVMNGELVLEEKSGILGMTRDTYEGSGVVKATALSMLKMPESELALDEINIDGVVYKTGNANILGLLGFECDFWYKEEDGERTICTIFPKQSTDYFEISSDKDEIVSISNSEIEYSLAEDLETNVIKIDSNTTVLYNCVAIDKDITSVIDCAKPFKGTISYVENKDGSCVVSIEERSDYIVESVGYHTSVLKGIGFDDEITLDGNRNFVSIDNARGKSTKVENLKTGDFVTVYRSKNSQGPKVIRVYISGTKIDGTVSKIYGEDIYIGDEVYTKSNHFSDTITVGQSGIFYLNSYGEIVGFSADDDPETPPFVGLYFDYAKTDDAFTTNVEIKLIDRTGSVKIYPVSEKVTYNGRKFTDVKAIISDITYEGGICKGLSSLTAEEAIRYRLNSEGKITMIDTCDILDGGLDDTLIKHNVSEKMRYYVDSGLLSSRTSGKALYYLPPDGKVFTFFGTVDRENFCTVDVAKTALRDESIPINGGVYSTDGNQYTADIVTLSRDKGSILYGDPIIISDVVTELDANGNTVKAIQGLDASGKEVKYQLSEETVPYDAERVILSNLKKGDVIRTRNRNTQVVAVEVVFLCDGADKRVYGAGEGDYISPIINKNAPVKGDSTSMYYRYIYGTVDYKDTDYMLIKTFTTVGDSKNEYNEFIANAEYATMYYKRADGEDAVVSGKSTSTIAKGDTVLAVIDDGVTEQLIVYDLD